MVFTIILDKGNIIDVLDSSDFIHKSQIFILTEYFYRKLHCSLAGRFSFDEMLDFAKGLQDLLLRFIMLIMDDRDVDLAMLLKMVKNQDL
mgnify:CR=1 FL=1